MSPILFLNTPLPTEQIALSSETYRNGGVFFNVTMELIPALSADVLI